MLSVLLLGYDRAAHGAAEPGDLVRTLASLVPATVEGLVRDLCLVGPLGEKALADVADHAGCALVAQPSFGDAVAAGSLALRCPSVLVLIPGVTIGRPVLDELSSLLPIADGGRTRAVLLKTERRDLLGRLYPPAAPNAGILVSRMWLQGSRADRFDELVRRAKPRRRLRAVAWPAL